MFKTYKKFSSPSPYLKNPVYEFPTIDFKIVTTGHKMSPNSLKGPLSVCVC